jgi:hypothetical protein
MRISAFLCGCKGLEDMESIRRREQNTEIEESQRRQHAFFPQKGFFRKKCSDTDTV